MKNKKKGLLSRITSSRVFRVMFARKTIVICTILILVMILLAVFAPVVTKYDPNKDDLYNVLQGCSAEHWLGTDANGRDVLTRIIYGGRISFTVGLVAVCISSVIGMALGLIAGVVGGMVDTVIMRIMDAMMAVPMLILALFLGAILGQGLFNVCLALGISMVPGYARITRGQVLSVRNADYVTAGTLSGASGIRNTLVHVFPNCLSANIVTMTGSLGGAILAEANLSFLGMGIAPPTASWGAMVSGGYKCLSTQPIVAIAPGIAIIIVVLCFNMVGDALRDALDPKLRGTLGKARKAAKKETAKAPAAVSEQAQKEGAVK